MKTIEISRHGTDFYVRSINAGGGIKGGFAGSSIPDLKKTVTRLMDELYPEGQAEQLSPVPTLEWDAGERYFQLEDWESFNRAQLWSESLTLDMEADAATRFMVPSEPEESKQHRYRYIAEKRKMAEHLRELAKKAKF